MAICRRHSERTCKKLLTDPILSSDYSNKVITAVVATSEMNRVDKNESKQESCSKGDPKARGCLPLVGCFSVHGPIVINEKSGRGARGRIIPPKSGGWGFPRQTVRRHAF
ncbi:hypothetical protein AVEN_219593-1 [Araneus ventricosus]|uniref:Uncharacterized protein n=1 Tax=Araneus ventricosus TaxID=182803 RepID=A0A4Y2S4N7_ARAVE|nr:hypothetical protein AVEN_219593-1 [Araneus ventricosus]